MAFRVKKSRDIGDELKKLRENNAQKKDTNVARRMTLGLTQLHQEIKAFKQMGSFAATARSMHHTNASGSFVISQSSLPTLDKRYSIARNLGTGRFSQVYVATDAFTQQPVCIKVMNSKYSLIGAREVLLLQELKAKAGRSVSFGNTMTISTHFDV